jgi:hypothetical protein
MIISKLADLLSDICEEKNVLIHYVRDEEAFEVPVNNNRLTPKLLTLYYLSQTLANQIDRVLGINQSIYHDRSIEQAIKIINRFRPTQ